MNYYCWDEDVVKIMILLKQSPYGDISMYMCAVHVSDVPCLCVVFESISLSYSAEGSLLCMKPHTSVVSGDYISVQVTTTPANI